jgi:hypothetical protein
MRKRVLLATCATFVAVLGINLAVGDGLGQHENSYGAVKTGLYERQSGDPAGGPGSGPLSGFCIINVDPCSEELLTNVVLKEGMGNTTYDVYVKINGAVNLVGNLYTNPNGKGAAAFFTDVSMYTGPEGPGTVDVQVVVKPENTTAIVGFATATVSERFPDCDPMGNRE